MEFPRCPVCLELLEDPVSLPCSHEFCLDCYKNSLESANFHCPLCRKRFSSWSRRNVTDPVNKKRKRELELMYDSLGPIESLKLATTLAEGGEERHDRATSEDGEIRSEYSTTLEQYRIEKEELEAEDREISFKLQEEEDEAATIETRRQIEEDERLAREMTEKDAEACKIELSAQLERDRKLAFEIQKELRKKESTAKKPKQEVTLFKWFTKKQ